MNKVKRKRPTEKKAAKTDVESMTEWLMLVQGLIAKHSTAPRKGGKFKGHGSTDVEAWMRDLTAASRRSLKITATSPFDENMAIALHVGSVLLAWWACVQRAKTYDPNRPLELRREVNKRFNDQIATVIARLSSDELVGAVFGAAQRWNFPFGRGAFGGEFT